MATPKPACTYQSSFYLRSYGILVYHGHVGFFVVTIPKEGRLEMLCVKRLAEEETSL